MTDYKHWANLAHTITHDKLSPFHYKQMYEQITEEKPQNNYGTDICENFRNHLHYNDNRFYHLKNGYFTLNKWIQPNKLLNGFDKFAHQISIDMCSEAAIEAGNRVKYMINKYDDDPITRLNKVYKGLLLEINTRILFENRYGIENVNRFSNNYRTPNPYDFKVFDLRIDVKTIGHDDNLWVEKNRFDFRTDVFLAGKLNGHALLLGYVCCDEKNHWVDAGKKHVYVSNKCLHDCRYLILYLNHLKYGFKLKQILMGGYSLDF